MRRGPVEVLFLTFTDNVALDDLASVLRQPVEAGVIRLIDCVLLMRDADGSVFMRDLEDEEGLPPELQDLAIEPNDLLSDLDLAVFVEALAEGDVGVVVVFEQVWALRAVQSIEKVGAQIGLYLRVPPFEVDAAFAAQVTSA